MAAITLTNPALGEEVLEAATHFGIRNEQFDNAPLAWRIGLIAMFAIIGGRFDIAKQMKLRLKQLEEAV